MAEHLNLSCIRALIFGLAFTWTAATFAIAETIIDPTQPPKELGRRSEAAASDANTEPVLQSILLSPTRKVAIISGRQVKVGDKFADLRVMKISETEVVLKNGGDIRTLKLFPHIEKQRASNHNRAK